MSLDVPPELLRAAGEILAHLPHGFRDRLRIGGGTVLAQDQRSGFRVKCLEEVSWLPCLFVMQYNELACRCRFCQSWSDTLKG
jgi:hypothetical protein